MYREQLGIQLNEYTDLTQKTMSTGFMYERDSGHFYEVKEPQDFDLVAFFINGRLFHVGVWIQNRLLHTSQAKNCRWEQLDRVALAQRRFYRYAQDRGS